MQGRIVFATGNAGKIKEIRMIMEDTGLEVVSMKDAGIKADIEENGKTYEENALIKARAVTAFTKDIVMADDSGLEIDALNKEPGIYSARYLGEDTPYSIKNANLIQRLEGVPEEKRTARFVCAIAAVLPDGRELTTRATIEGRIGYEEKGTNGFGYDPIFYVPEFGKSTAELTEEEKNQVSHRGKALELMKDERFHGEAFCTAQQLRTPLLLKNLEGRGDLIPIALRRLAAHNREKDTQYCETLYHYLTCCHSLKKTSDALYTHRNTVLYRIRRLQEDFAIPLEEPSQHADLLLGVSLILFEIKGPDFFLRAPKNEA